MDYSSPAVIGAIGSFLQQPIPRAQEDLEAHIIGLEALRYDLAEATVDWLRLIYEKRKQMLWPKDAEKKFTELDRTTRLNADVAIIERDYAFLQKLEGLVTDRIHIAMTMLA